VLYIDSSSLLKLLWREAESDKIASIIEEEDDVVISSLAELESLVQLKAAWLGGEYSLAQLRHFEARLAIFKNRPPFEFRAVTGVLFKTALRQHRNERNLHCRTLDRLHLAAMEDFGLSRLLTHDFGQAKVAEACGFVVIHP